MFGVGVPVPVVRVTRMVVLALYRWEMPEQYSTLLRIVFLCSASVRLT